MHSINSNITPSSVKKILIVTRPLSPPWDEASKNFIYTLAKNISDENFKITILTDKINSDLPKNIVQEKIYTSNNFNLKQKYYLLKYLMGLKSDFDIIHYVFTPTKLNSFLIKNLVKNKGAKIIQTIATLREDLFPPRNIKNIIFGDSIITYSNYSKDKLEEIGIKNVARIYPGIDLEYYSPSSKNLKLMDDWNISSNSFVITYPGEYSRLGATDDIIDSLPKIFKIIPEAKFIFACRIKNDHDLQKKNDLKEKLKSANLLDKTIFTDTYFDMPRIYNLSDVIIFPVRNMKGKFDIPLAVIEAMACGKPVIISDLPLLKEFSNNQNSVTIQNGNAQQLVTALSDLHKNRDRGITIGINARKYTEENFDIKKVVKKYEDIYKIL